MREERKISFKNYIILSVVLIFSIIVIIYFYLWYNEIEENKLQTPILNEYLNIINYNELDDYLIENNEVIIYVSILSDSKIRNFEKKFKKDINNYSLENYILYLNLTDESNKITNKFLEEYKIISLPCVIIYRDGKVLDVYNIANNNYDVDLLISYFRIEGIIND